MPKLISTPEDEEGNLIPSYSLPGEQAQLPVFPMGNARPLDPNGIDVPGELPLMQKTYNEAGRGRALVREGASTGVGSGRQEVGYAMFKPDGLTGSTYHTAPQVMSGYHDLIKYPRGTTAALFHTHPPGASPHPSPGDMEGSVTKHLPNYVYSEDDKGVPSLYVTRPDTKAFYQYKVADWHLGKK